MGKVSQDTGAVLDLRSRCWDVVPLAPIILFGFFTATYYLALEFRRSTTALMAYLGMTRL